MVMSSSFRLLPTAVVLLLAACGGSNAPAVGPVLPTPGATSTDTGPPASPGTASVGAPSAGTTGNIPNSTQTPAGITVPIIPGTTSPDAVMPGTTAPGTTAPAAGSTPPSGSSAPAG